MYDTLLQMGRWFGFRGGYEDLTRIYTTPELQGWFSDLAFVEHQLRQDIRVYEDHNVTPQELGMRIWQHPAMQVTSRLKRRSANPTVISQSYSLSLEQTFRFPLRTPQQLAVQAEANQLAVKALVRKLGKPSAQESKGPIWNLVPFQQIIEFLESYRVDTDANSISLPLITAYIAKLVEFGELINWTVAVCGRETPDRQLGHADWGLSKGLIAQISRSRIGETDSLGVITSPGDELLGLPEQLQLRAKEIVTESAQRGERKSINRAAREVRPATTGLLLLYPISRHSGHDLKLGQNRRSLFPVPLPPSARDLVGIAISFPESHQHHAISAFLEGTARWRPME
jgi:hypothetical protein